VTSELTDALLDHHFLLLQRLLTSVSSTPPQWTAYLKERSMKRRGEYTCDRIHPVKFRASPKTFETLLQLSESKGVALACIVRDLVEEVLQPDKEE
jgi:hypothetical protein